MNNADMEFFTSASAPTPNIECPETQTTPNEGFDFMEPETLDEDDDFEKLRLAREKERQERQKQKLARSISTQQQQNTWIWKHASSMIIVFPLNLLKFLLKSIT